MHKISDYLDRKGVPCNPCKVFAEIKPLTVMRWGRKARWLGVVIDHEVLVLDFKQMLPCRILLRNLTRVQYPILMRESPTTECSIEYVRDFFRENCDNPYALWNWFRCVASGDKPPFTQLPPLAGTKNSEEHSKSIARMHDLAQSADSVFTFNRKSGLHNLIRRYDRGMFGHCAMVSARKTIYESSTSGFIESTFDDLDDPSLDVGLYRHRNVSEEQRQAMCNAASKWVGRPGYDWPGVLYLAVLKVLKIRHKMKHVSPADLIAGGALELVCYA